MARITVEDCLNHVDNRFNLVLLAARRARQLAIGHQPLVDWGNDKPTVVALREIADGLVRQETLDVIDAEVQVVEEVPTEEEEVRAEF